MPSLAEILKDKRGFTDDQSISLANGEKFTLGELRTMNDATQGELARTIEAEKQNLAKEREVLTRAQQEVVDLWAKVNGQQAEPLRKEPVAGATWMDDPILSPIASHLKSTYDPRLEQISTQIANFQKALGVGVKYIVDRFVESDYRSLPENFRKETNMEAAVRMAQEKKYFDQGGAPDVRKVYSDWEAPRKEESIRASAYEKAKADILAEQRQQAVIDMKPGFMGGPGTKETGTKSANFSEALAKAWADPEILSKLQA